MTEPLYSDEAIIRSVTYSTRGGHKVSFEMDPEGWEAFKGMETTRCMMVLVPIQNNGQPDPDAKPFSSDTDTVKTDKPKRRMSELNRSKQAGILCNDEQFQRFVNSKVSAGGEDDLENAVGAVRHWCGVKSRAELDMPGNASKLWDQLRTEYDVWRGAIGRPD